MFLINDTKFKNILYEGILYMFREEFIKIVTNISFYLAIVAVVILIMSKTFYTKADTGKEYTFFDAVFNTEHKEITKDSKMSACDIIIDGINSEYYDMFIPLVVVIPFVAGIYSDKKNSITRFQIYRTGKLRYTLGKLMAVMVTGGLITMSAQIIFSIIIYIIFPHGKTEMFEISKMMLKQDSVWYKFILNNIGDMSLYLMKFIRVFLYGAFSTVTAFALSSVIKNRYIVFTIPVVIEYMWGRLINKSGNPNLYSLRPSAIGNIFHNNFSWMLPFFIIIVITALVFYRVCLGKKCDCGED